MSIIGRILERLGFKAREGFLEGSGSAGYSGSTIIPGNIFRRRLECFLKDPDTYTAVLSLTSLVVGSGFHVSGREDAVKIVDEFNYRVGMDQVLFKAISEMLWSGNSFWLKVYDSGRLVGLRHIPLTMISAIHRDDYEIRFLEVQTLSGGILKIDFEKIAHFYFIKHGGEVLGSPINRPLLESRTIYDPDRGAVHELPSYYDIKWGMEWAMWKVLMKYPPRHIYQFPRIGGEAQREYAEKIKRMLPGEDIITNQEIKVIEVKMDPRARFDAYVEYLDNKVTIGLMNSILRLFTKPGFTEASAREANRIQANIVAAIQRAVKRVVEREIYDPLLRSHGIDPIEAEIRFNWGIPEKPRITLEDVQRFYTTPPHVEPALTREEVRKILRSLGFPLISEELREDWRIIESEREIVVQLKNPEKVKPESVRDIVIDPDRGIRLTFYEADNGLEILAAIFDKNRWRDPEEAENWLRENLDAIKLYFNANGGRGSP
ncbi:MAG: hypothetical protein J7K78_02685 [Thaumarchaeota archaeon]|nr:hypothetical protein [Nitrososphaerota archaeon]